MLTLAFLLPLFQELNDGVLHLFWGIRLREILSELLAFEGNPLQLSLFDFSQNVLHGFQGAAAFLAELPQALGLREGRRRLGEVHGFDDMQLFFGRQVGQFDGGIKGDLLLVDHVQEFRDQVGEADESMNLISAFACFLTNDIQCLQLHPNLG